MEDRIKHLEMIQAVIGRLSQHSFLIKGWSVTLVAAIIALSADGSDERFVWMAYFASFAFWCLDGHFLRTEKLFRALYDDVRQPGTEVPPFSMDTSRYKATCPNTLKVCFSWTLFLFHATVFASVILMMIVIVF
ncbi:MAG: hypothetical protein AAFR95_13075 [Bacteroidota bacterium]